MKKCFIAILIVFSIVNNTTSEELKNKFYVVGDLGLINNTSQIAYGNGSIIGENGI